MHRTFFMSPEFKRKGPGTLAFISLVGLAGLGAAGCSRAEATETLPPANPSAAVPVTSILKEASKAENQRPTPLTASGTTHAIREANLTARATGVMVKLMVDEGDRVKEGQALFQIDARGAAIHVQQARVNLASAKVGETSAKEDLDRKEGLAKTGSVPEAVLTAARLRMQEAQLAVKRAEVGLSDANRNAGETVVRSPISGVIASKNINQGESVTAFGAPVLLVQDISELEVKARLPESSLARIKPGSVATAHFRSVNATREVTVKRLSPSVDQRTRTIEVVFSLPNEDEQLKAGMLVELDFGGTGESGKPAPTAAPQAAPSAEPQQPPAGAKQ